MDNLVFEESITTETDQSEFTEKKWVYVNDNNAQNYSSLTKRAIHAHTHN